MRTTRNPNKRIVEFVKNIKDDLTIFDKKFKKTLSQKASLLHRVTNYIVKNPGKKIRPICVILSAGLVNNINDKIYRGAILIELLHTATLIHDDIVDDAHMRRSRFSINSIWKNKISVLTGDYFLAKGLSLAVQHSDYDILKLISKVVEDIVKGELLQLEKTKRLNLTKEDYFKIIKLKTASLFECSFNIGAMCSNLGDKTSIQLRELGYKIGILFQVKDDILDYGTQSNNSGKKSGNDIKEGKINLPLLYAFERMSNREKSRVYQILRKKNNPIDEIKLVEQIVIRHKGIEKSELLINNYYNEAMLILDNFKSNKYKDSIISLLNFLTHRSK